MHDRIAFMQGRLSPLVHGRIQAFPLAHWREEFKEAEALSLRLVEWTLDQDRLHDNPFITQAGRDEIRALSARHGLRVATLTGDCFMQVPFWKADGTAAQAALADLDLVIASAAALGVEQIVVPLVDNGSVETAAEEEALLRAFEKRAVALAASGTGIAFESDYPPEALRRFIARFPEVVGINYDIGNSAALGFDPREEIAAYGGRITNVHVKDRLRGGTTVPLGTGNADLPGAVAALEHSGYRGLYVLQTARAIDGEHSSALARYRDMLINWIEGAWT